MRKGTSFVLCGMIAVTVMLSGCGEKGGQNANKSQKAQSPGQEQAKPIDTELQQQMKMYQDLKKSEYEQLEKIRKEDQKRLKQLQKAQAESLQRELEFQEKVRQGTDLWSGGKKKNQSGEQSADQKQGKDQGSTKGSDKKSGGQQGQGGGKSSSGS